MQLFKSLHQLFSFRCQFGGSSGGTSLTGFQDGIAEFFFNKTDFIPGFSVTEIQFFNSVFKRTCLLYGFQQFVFPIPQNTDAS